MAKLIYSAITSLDGYVEDEEGRFDWAAPDDEVHAFVNDLERPIGTYLYGRRMYETMVFWETVTTDADQPAVIRDFAELWRAAEKVVYSRTFQTVFSERTRIERDLVPDAVRRLKEASKADITIGGAEREEGLRLGAGCSAERVSQIRGRCGERGASGIFAHARPGKRTTSRVDEPETDSAVDTIALLLDDHFDISIRNRMGDRLELVAGLGNQIS
jgi:dihydrofolate reductase